MRNWFFLIAIFIGPVVIAAEISSAEIPTPELPENRDTLHQIISLIAERQPIEKQLLQEFKNDMSSFSTILTQKLDSASHATKSYFTPIILLVQDILKSTNDSATPSDYTYSAIETILTEIGNNPVLSMTNNEVDFSSGRNVLATISPNKGQGATYVKDEPIQFTLTAANDCYVQVFFLAPETNDHDTLKPLLLYPDNNSGSVRMKAGQRIIIGSKGEFVVQPPYGNDLVFVVASDKELQIKANPEEIHFSSPFSFDNLLTKIYDPVVAGKLSFNSSFFVSHPPEQHFAGNRSLLLTKEEADIFRLDDKEWLRPPLIYRSISAGPIIRVHEPPVKAKGNPTIETISPMDLKITFEQNDSPVDMNTLEVTAKKGFLSKSITNRVREYIDGTVLDARNIDFPKGKFRIQVEIADVAGIITSQEYRLEVQ